MILGIEDWEFGTEEKKRIYCRTHSSEPKASIFADEKKLLIMQKDDEELFIFHDLKFAPLRVAAKRASNASAFYAFVFTSALSATLTQTCT
jgi:hypothetical protein